MRTAERFGLPILTFIDTPGAYPGSGAEERGIAESIAVSLRQMSTLRVPMIATVIGEGGSGGALAIGVTNRVNMLEHSVYSVISPESCSSILWRDAEHTEEAAEALRLTANDLIALGIVDEIIPEPPGGAHTDPFAMGESLGAVLARQLDELTRLPADRLVDDRYAKFRAMGSIAAE
jgi:acetyl-CoA carboxylase carboxyl transferase subunit alpha